MAVSLVGYLDGSGFATDKSADTQTTKVEASAEKGKDEDSGAKKEEGGVASKDEKFIIYSPLTGSIIDFMLAMPEEDTSISTECLAMGTGDALERIQTEADNPQMDIFWSGTIGIVKNKSEYFMDYTTSNEDAFYGEYKDIEGNLTCFGTIPSVIMMNTDLIGDIRMERYKNLLNPELKGRVAFADLAASSSSFEYLINMPYATGGGNPDNGWDHVKQFCTQLDGKPLDGSFAVYKGVADGEYTAGPTFEQDSAQYVGVGAPVKAVYMSEDVVFQGDGVYTIKGCPNESDTQKFMNWLTSKDVQEFMNDTQYRRTVRKDIEARDAMASMDQVRAIRDDEADAATHKSGWLDEFKGLFIE